MSLDVLHQAGMEMDRREDEVQHDMEEGGAEEGDDRPPEDHGSTVRHDD